MTDEAIRLGVLGGTRLPGNVKTFLANLRRLLYSHERSFECDLLLTGDVDDSIEGYRTVDPGIEQPARALDALRTLTAATTRYARSTDVDLLFQATRFPTHGFAVSVAGYRTDTPAVTRLAGDNFNEYRHADGLTETVRLLTLKNGFGRVPAALSDAVVVLGPHGRNEIRSRSRSTRVREIPQPVDPDRFYPIDEDERMALRSEFGYAPEERVLLSVGRLTRRKGTHLLAEAAASLRDHDDIRWVVLGEGPVRDRLSTLPNVDTPGRIPHARMPDYYRTADLLVHASPLEGLPNVLLESIACGTPTLARDVGDCAVAATETFTDVESLPFLVQREYDRETLPADFEFDRLATEYGDLFETVARGGSE